ncbi:condensin-2 complex subunit G2-like isoform X2 [Planococcus citri]|uniref:condensin-2 complex subunit G2-like isoform X2 n=1 Tax=Planococcus citri TaxID=170843 RepID=UPI0031F9EA49
MKRTEKKTSGAKGNGQRNSTAAAEMANLPETADDDWIKHKELIDSNLNLLSNTNEVNEERDRVLESIKVTINNTNNSIKAISTMSTPLRDYVGALIPLMKMKHIDVKTRFSIADIMFTLSDNDLVPFTHSNFIPLVGFLVENCPVHMHEKHMNTYIRKLRKLLNAMYNDEDLKSDCTLEIPSLLQMLDVLLLHVPFCSTDNGIEIVGHIVALHETVIKEFQARIKQVLFHCSKTEAFAFGKIYFRVWELVSDEMKKFVEEECIQWIMDRAFTLGRQENARKFLSVNVQNLLSGLHCCRKSAKFSQVITTLYSPLIWKYLSSDNAIYRANAAEIFMNVYPLEKPQKGKTVYSQFLRKQHDEMLALLNDRCPAVRVIAIRGICANMKYFWITFQNGTAEEVVKKLISEMVLDGSSADVRKSVYQGFTQLLENSDSHRLLKSVLPSLSQFLHDENKSVRQAFLNMLLKIKNTPCEIKYFQIVDLVNIAARLEVDSLQNQSLIVKLIFSSFFGPKISIEETFKRLCKFIKVNPAAARNLATCSKEVLPLKEAAQLMCLILLHLYKNLKKKMEPYGDENKESDADANENVDANSSATSSDSTRKLLSSVCDPIIAHGLFDFVAILWLINGKRLSEPENKELLNQVHSCSIKCIPPALRYFRDTHVFYGVLNLAGMMPLSTIQHQTTVVGSCLSMLRQMSDESSASEYHCIIHVLCIWNRGDDILELIKEWLNEGFRSENLNETFSLQRRESMRKKRVKFMKPEAKPKLALSLLQAIFNSQADQKLIFSKNINCLTTLFEFLSKIKKLVENRISKGSELNNILNDDFLKETFALYGNFMIMFSQNEVSDFNFWKKFAKHIEWCDKILGQGRSLVDTNGDDDEDEQSTFAGEMLQVPLIQSYHLVALGKCSDNDLILLSTFCLTALNSNNGLYCVEAAVQFVKQLLLFSRAHHEGRRNNDVMMIWLPRLLDTTLSLLTEKNLTKDELSVYIKNFTTLRNTLIFNYMLITKLYPKLLHGSLSYQVLYSFCNHLINIVLFPIRECETLNVDQSIKNLPTVGSLLAAVLISQVELASGFLFVLKKIIGDYTDNDVLNMLAVSSLLYTLASTGGKIKPSEILKVVQITHTKLQSITTEEGGLALVMNHERSVGDRTIIDIEETNELAVKEIGKHILKLIAEHLKGSLT